MPIWVVAVILYISHLVGLLVVAVGGSKRPASTLTWLTFCLVLPFLGLVVYLLLTRKVHRRNSLPWEIPSCEGMIDRLTRTLHLEFVTQSLSATAVARGIARFSSPPVQANLKVYHAGEPFYRELVKSIQGAQSSIDIEFYIFRYDEVGKTVIEALLERLQAGVEVRFLLDGFGSRKFPQDVIAQLNAAGAQCRIFSPIGFPFLRPSVNNRDHCKIVVIDKTTAFSGGMNVGREYAGKDPSYGPWRDTHVKIEAKVPLPLADLFEANFELGTLRTAQLQPRSGHRRTVSNLPDKSARKGAPKVDANNYKPGLIQFLQSGPDTPRQNLRELYFLCLTQATRQVDITTPYFLPESDLLMGLYTAVARGVRVRLLLPERVDHRVIGFACQTYFPSLLHAGVEIYLHRPGVLHAKVMTVDDDLAVVGAANYDLRSFRLNYEVAMVQYGHSFVEELRRHFNMDLEVSRRLEIHQLHSSLIHRVKHHAARLLAPLL